MPIAGRGPQLVHLLRSKDAVQLISGPSGSGKTRLMAEFAAHADRFTDVLYVGCRRSNTGVQFVVDLANELGADTIGRDTPFLVERDSGWIEPDPHLRWLQMRLCLADAIAERTARSPILIMIDDVHRLDEPYLDLLLELIDRSEPGSAWCLAVRSGADEFSTAALVRRGVRSMVTLPPLKVADIEHLLDPSKPHDSSTDRNELAQTIWSESGGNPLIASELIGMAPTSSSPSGPADDRFRAVIGSVISELDPGSRTIVEMMAMADDVQLDLSVLADAMGTDEFDNSRRVRCVDGRRTGGRPRAGTLGFRSSVVGRVARQLLGPHERASASRPLVPALYRSRSAPYLLASLLLDIDGRSPDEDTLVDVAVTDACSVVLRLGDTATAAALAGRYLDKVGTSRVDDTSVRAQLSCATSLMAAGEVRRGHALLELLGDRIMAFDDPALEADLVLARGPVDTGNTILPADLERFARLLARLDPTDAPRRVQVACWAAHHAINRGDRTGALDMLDEVTVQAATANAAAFRSLELAVRVQADYLVDGGPSLASASYRRLIDWVHLTGDVAGNAAASLLGVTDAFVTGTLDDVRARCDELQSVANELRRPDLRWWPSAIAVSLALAEGNTARARTLLEESSLLGDELSVGVAPQVSMIQRTLLMLQDGSLGMLHSTLGNMVASGVASPTVVATYGISCLVSGDENGLEHAATAPRRRGSVAQIGWRHVAVRSGSLHGDRASDVEHTAGKLADHRTPTMVRVRALHSRCRIPRKRRPGAWNTRDRARRHRCRT